MNFERFAVLLVVVAGDWDLFLLRLEFQLSAFDPSRLSKDRLDLFRRKVTPRGGLGCFVTRVHRFDVGVLELGFAGAKSHRGRAGCDACRPLKAKLSSGKGHSQGCLTGSDVGRDGEFIGRIHPSQNRGSPRLIRRRSSCDLEGFYLKCSG